MCQADWCSPKIYAVCDVCVVSEINQGKLPLLCVWCIEDFNKIDHVAEFEKELDRGSWDV